MVSERKKDFIELKMGSETRAKGQISAKKSDPAL